MTNPAIQNDFSYYRRTISRNRINNLQVRGQCPPPAQELPSPSRAGGGWAGGSGCSPISPRPLQLDAESEVNNEMANRMSLFYAEATPMLKTLSNATTKFVSEVSGAGGAAGGAEGSKQRGRALLSCSSSMRGPGWAGGPGCAPPGSCEGDSPGVLPAFRTKPSQSRTRLTA